MDTDLFMCQKLINAKAKLLNGLRSALLSRGTSDHIAMAIELLGMRVCIYDHENFFYDLESKKYFSLAI